MHGFNPGDKVIKSAETNSRNYGHVMDLQPSHMKPGWVAVYFQRQVWVKPENLMHFEEWENKQSKREQVVSQGNLKNYWNGAI